MLGGTGLVEAGTYLAILMGTIVAGFLTQRIWMAAVAVLVIAVIGFFTGRLVPPAPREGARLKLNYNPFTASWRLIRATLHIPRLFLADLRDQLLLDDRCGAGDPVPAAGEERADRRRACRELRHRDLLGWGGDWVGGRQHLAARPYLGALFTDVGDRDGRASLWCFRSWRAAGQPAPPGQFYGLVGFLAEPRAYLVLLTLLGIAVTGGMFVVPLYAFLTTTVEKDQTARTVAANKRRQFGGDDGGVVIGCSASPRSASGRPTCC